MENVSPVRAPRRQLLILAAVFAGVVALLALGYYLFLSTAWVVLFQGMRPADAAAVVAELDKRGAVYRLRDDGTTILVPENDADAARVAIAGSDAAARGQIGFELFNKSDMGLTNFAQKINYQRALQGELVRTISMMDGVDSARVHLALPERTLFRGDRAEPRAAVTVSMKPGQTADPSRVAGIQRLVAAAVPDLPESAVVVLDSAGRVISAAAAPGAAELEAPADLEERSAVERYYRARARGAAERAVPGLKFTLKVLALPLESSAAAPADPATGAPAAEWVPSGEGAARNFKLRVLFVTEAAIGPEDQAVIRNAIVPALALNAPHGDTLSFETGPLEPVVAPAPVAAPVTGVSAAIPPVTAPLQAPAMFGLWTWLLAALAVGVVILIVLRLRSGGRARLSGSDHDAFAARLRRQLNLEEGSDAAA
jgi:flagellar M-ring protein FliF